MELSERKLRWRFFWRRAGVAAGTVGVIIGVYILALTAVVGGWLPLTFKLAQALMFVIPPLLLVPITLIALLLAYGCSESVRRSVDKALPCGGRQWRAMKMRGRQNSSDEIFDNICVSLHCIAITIVLLPVLHSSWYHVPGSTNSTRWFSLVLGLATILGTWLLYESFRYMDTKQGVIFDAKVSTVGKPSSRVEPGDETEVNSVSGVEMPEAARQVLLRKRHVFRDSDEEGSRGATDVHDSDALDASKVKNYKINGPVFSTIRLTALSCILYAALSLFCLYLYAAMGGEVAKCLEVLSEVSVSDVIDAFYFAIEGGDRKIYQSRTTTS
jgi:hypothetical protein